MEEKRYQLSSGTQVRQEDFGLLFYTKEGPRLYFLPARHWMTPAFFNGKTSLDTWLTQRKATALMPKIRNCLENLCQKGVIREC